MNKNIIIFTIFMFVFLLEVLIYDGFAENTNKVETGKLQLNNSNPIEIGYVDWYRDFDQAIDISKKKISLYLFYFKKSPAVA